MVVFNYHPFMENEWVLLVVEDVAEDSHTFFSFLLETQRVISYDFGDSFKSGLGSITQQSFTPYWVG